ncbi:MAG: L-rhamnose isomerase [Spirochaetales bacterium]
MKAYDVAREVYREWGVDTEAALERMHTIPLSIHCWQADDVMGFEGATQLTGGILATGNYPGRARNVAELQSDFEVAHRLIPGVHRMNLHAMYLEQKGKRIDRNEIEPEHFEGWIDWARSIGIALDFNPTFFSHEKSSSGFTLAHWDAGIRRFWIEHGRRSRRVAEHIGKKLGTVCTNNIWIPDGWKDHPADRIGPRLRLIESLDEILDEPLDSSFLLDAVESKLFGIGSEAYVVGSHEFYLCYALKRGIALTLDAGHFHPTEQIADKIPALLPFIPRIILHVSRSMRWDSDHVVLWDDSTQAIMREIHRANAWDRVYIALDYFDASINRIAAWILGARNALKAILFSLLEPVERIRQAEAEGNLTERLICQEEAKTLPFKAVWDEFCERCGVPQDRKWMEQVRAYEKDVLSRRGG